MFLVKSPKDVANNNCIIGYTNGIYPAFICSGGFSFFVTTNKSFYEKQDVIVISGNVYPIMYDVPVIVQIIADGLLIDVAQITVAQDGSFLHSQIADGPLWKRSGDYTVKSSYGTQSTESNFEFISSEKIVAVTDVFEVDADNFGTFDMQYSIEGGIIEYIRVEPSIFGLIVGIDSPNNGKITVELPRQYIDSTEQNGEDEIFIILIDGIEVPYLEESLENSVTRTISINFEQDDKVIEIIGTRVVPEFGLTVMVIFSLTLILSILLSRCMVSWKLLNN